MGFFGCYIFFGSKISFIFFSISLLRFSVLSLGSVVFVITYLSILIIAALESLSDNSNICIVLELVSVGYLFPYELKLSWFCVCQVILNFILDILNILGLWCLFKILCRMLTFLL